MYLGQTTSVPSFCPASYSTIQSKQAKYESALDELLLAEESFGLCDPLLIGSVDNVGMLLLDIVWVCYKLGDVRRLAVCKERLDKVRAVRGVQLQQ